MGFSCTDLKEELEPDGLIGLLYIFFLSVFFSKLLNEMISVSRYFSFEVFKICKYFAADTIELIRKNTLHKYFIEENKALEINFLFYTGMILDWFSKIIKNEEFHSAYSKVLKNAKNSPQKCIDSAKKELDENYALKNM